MRDLIKRGVFWIAFGLIVGFPAQGQSSAVGHKYQSLLKKAQISDAGFISVHVLDGDLYLEIPDSILGRDLLLASRVEQLSSNKNAVAGQMMHNPMLVRWSRDENNVYLHNVQTDTKVDPGDPISVSFQENSMPTVMQVFKIEAFNSEGHSCVINVSRFFNSQIDQISPFGGASLGKPIPEITGTVSARAYEQNVEVVTQMGFEGSRSAFNCALHRSILLLPETPMQPRLASSQIGYYSEPQKELSSQFMDVKTFAYVKRWRIQAKKEDLKRHMNGELVEPEHPIVFYVDNAIPQKWKPYIKAGIEDWQKAFEAIGFKNAIVARDYPVNDSSFFENDITRSCFRYVTTDKANAMGNHWIDPRSGEIIQGDVLFYHNVFKKLYQWRFAQTAACDPAIRGDQNAIDEAVMGELVRYAAAHEIGHALGLMHNYRASYAYPVDSLRSATFTQRYGTAASIMDYARNNYIAQPEDKGIRLTPPILGVYDYFSIKWAYQPIYSAKSAEEEVDTLNRWIEERSNDDMFRYGPKNGMGDGCLDPSALTESLGDDVVKAARYGVKNSKQILQNLIAWTSTDPNQVREMRDAVFKQYSEYPDHAQALLGGRYVYEPTSAKYPDKYVPVSKARQKEAVGFIMGELLTQYHWMVNDDITALTGSYNLEIMDQQMKTIQRLLDRAVLVRMFRCASTSDDPYTPGSYLADLTRHLFSADTKQNQTEDWLRNLQAEYVKGLKKLLTEHQTDGGHLFNNLIMADVKAELHSIHAIISKPIPKGNDILSKHYAFLKSVIEL